MPRSRQSLPARRPLVSVDVAVLTLIDARLHVLLLERPDAPGEPDPGAWALPGGFVDVDVDASLEACARRVLRERTGIEAPWLEQVAAHGGRGRDPRGWSVSLLHAALVPVDRALALCGAPGLRWHRLPRSGRPRGARLALDHGRLVAEAVARIRRKSEYTDLPVRFLPEPFTLPEMQAVFEAVLDRPIDKKAFRTRVLASELLVAIDGARRPTGKRPARLWRLRDRRRLHVFRRALEGGDVAA